MATEWGDKPTLRHLAGKGNVMELSACLQGAITRRVKPWIAGWFTQGAYVRGTGEGRKHSRVFQRVGVNVRGKANILTGKLKWRYLTGDDVEGAAYVADIDGDGEKEAVFGSWDDYVYCLKPDGTLKWRRNVGGDVTAGGWVVFDIDNDGKLEVLAINHYGNTLYCLNSDGTVRWTYTTGNTLNGMSCAIYDVDGDGDLEILFGSVDHFLYCLKTDGTLKWRYKSEGMIEYSSPAVADIDGDGEVEILFGTFAIYAGEINKIYCLKPDGTLKWSYLTGGDIRGLAVYDVDGDGKLEVLAVSYEDKYLYCLESDGSLKWRYKADDRVAFGSPSADDLDDDGLVEVFFGSGDNYLYCLESD